MDEAYVKKLENVIEQFPQPLKGLPFPLVIKALTGYQVVPSDKDNPQDAELLRSLEEAAVQAAQTAAQQGIFARRPNEAGNRMEPFLRDALTAVGLQAHRPKAKSGKYKSAGYPDIQVVDTYLRVFYLDCKTYNVATKGSTMRSFFLSPSDDPKITCDAHHLLVAFELERTPKRDRGVELAFRPVRWQIYTLDKLQVSVKHEFNASNADLYQGDGLLSEGTV